MMIEKNKVDVVVHVAKALAAFDADGHNDAPLYEDYDVVMQGIYREQAQWVLRALRELGLEVPLEAYR